MLMNLIVVLLLFVVIGAVIAIWTRDLLSAIIAMGVVGFTRTVVFVLLRAPDVAITQVVVEVLLLIILIRSAVRREVHTVAGSRSVPGAATVAALVVVMLVLGVVAIRELPPFGEPTALARPALAAAAGQTAPAPASGAKSAEAEAGAKKNPDVIQAQDIAPPTQTYIARGQDDTGVGNIVTAVLLDYRGYDTLGEATVLFTATIGAIVLLRGRSRRNAEEETE